ncbi:MAG: hypothetical protein ACJ74M_03135 [Gaiellaceae bacterium]|jgi:hypothetical protein
MMPALDEYARTRLARTLLSLNGAIALFEAQHSENGEPSVERLKRLRDDIETVLRVAAHERS